MPPGRTMVYAMPLRRRASSDARFQSSTFPHALSNDAGMPNLPAPNEDTITKRSTPREAAARTSADVPLPSMRFGASTSNSSDSGAPKHDTTTVASPSASSKVSGRSTSNGTTTTSSSFTWFHRARVVSSRPVYCSFFGKSRYAKHRFPLFGSRTPARTRYPRLASSRTVRKPTFPVAPATKTTASCDGGGPSTAARTRQRRPRVVPFPSRARPRPSSADRFVPFPRTCPRACMAMSFDKHVEGGDGRRWDVHVHVHVHVDAPPPA
mmetsp:Transcript_171/g.1280  ORF Transcript_171/g.1280 Transcript_171/m.1280 type:complete len:266 (+) Transcript_171:693-1490(+)